MSTIRRFFPLGVFALAGLTGCEAQIDIDLSGGALDGADQVVVQIEAVELRRADGQTVTINTDNGADVDLLQLRNGQTLPLVSGREIGASRFTGVRLLYADSDSFVAPEDEADVSLTTPSNPSFTDIDFALGDEDNVRLVINLDPRFSVGDRRGTSNDFELRPFIRAAVPEESAGITGRIDDALVESAACRRDRDTIGVGVAVYVYTGSNPQLDDFLAGGSGSSGPIASAELEGSTGSYRYNVSLLAPGTYTVALTCDADRDDPLTEDDMDFTLGDDITLQEDQTGTVDFES